MSTDTRNDDESCPRCASLGQKCPNRLEVPEPATPSSAAAERCPGCKSPLIRIDRIGISRWTCASYRYRTGGFERSETCHRRELMPVIFGLRDDVSRLEQQLAAVTAERDGMTLKIRAADAMAKAVDDAVRRGSLNSRSAIADARLDYGEPFPVKECQRR